MLARRSLFWLIPLLWGLTANGVGAQDSPPATPPRIPEAIAGAQFPLEARELMADVRFLAHSRLRGRAAGSPDEAIAALYVASHFDRLGLTPAGPEGSWEWGRSIS